MLRSYSSQQVGVLQGIMSFHVTVAASRAAEQLQSPGVYTITLQANWLSAPAAAGLCASVSHLPHQRQAVSLGDSASASWLLQHAVVLPLLALRRR